MKLRFVKRACPVCESRQACLPENILRSNKKFTVSIHHTWPRMFVSHIICNYCGSVWIEEYNTETGQVQNTILSKQEKSPGF